MSNYKPKKDLPEAIIVAAYRSSPATSRDLAAHYGVLPADILKILHDNIPATTFRDLGNIKRSRTLSRAMRIVRGTNRPPRLEG